MKQILVSPKDGVTVRHPENGFPIKPETTVNLTPQIKRYLKDGDLVEVKAKVAPKAKPAKKTASQEAE